jgi:hypothetical protein
LPLADRWVTTPPALYVYGTPEYKRSVEGLNRRISQLKATEPDQLKQLIRDERITHVFVGGTNAGPIKPDMLFGDPMFTPLYDENGVTIFAVRASS